jgi:hypothetical protein
MDNTSVNIGRAALVVAIVLGGPIIWAVAAVAFVWFKIKGA